MNSQVFHTTLTSTDLLIHQTLTYHTMQPVVKFSRKDPELFFQTLRERVNQYFDQNDIKKTGNGLMYRKTIAMFAMYFVPFVIILTQTLPAWTVILLYFLMGIGLSGIGLSVMHDANHGSYSESSWVNRLMAHSMTIIGGSPFTWKVQHNFLHHTYTNIYELDEDIDDKPFLRLSPHGELKSYHRFQHHYAMFLYSLATISWILMKDFKQMVHYHREGLTQKCGFKPTRETIFLIGTKILYVMYAVVLPIALGVAWWAVLIGFVLMHMLAGVVITTIFQLAHVVEGPEHFTPEKTGTMENTWAIHQLKTTANFARNNWFITWFVGGLNFQIEHHLFPHVCHVHYKKISEIVKKTAQECNLSYFEHQTFTKAVASHLRVLKSLGNDTVLEFGQEHQVSGQKV